MRIGSQPVPAQIQDLMRAAGPGRAFRDGKQGQLPALRRPGQAARRHIKSRRRRIDVFRRQIDQTQLMMHGVQSGPVALCPPPIPDHGQRRQMAAIWRQGEIRMQAVCEMADLAGSNVQPDQLPRHGLPGQIIAHLPRRHCVAAPGRFPEIDTGPSRGHADACVGRLGALWQRRIDEVMIRDPDRFMNPEPGQGRHPVRAETLPGRQIIQDQPGGSVPAFDQDQDRSIRRQALQIGMRVRIESRQPLRRRLRPHIQPPDFMATLAEGIHAKPVIGIGVIRADPLEQDPASGRVRQGAADAFQLHQILQRQPAAGGICQGKAGKAPERREQGKTAKQRRHQGTRWSWKGDGGRDRPGPAPGLARRMSESRSRQTGSGGTHLSDRIPPGHRPRQTGFAGALRRTD